tara:strand:+ start:79290 stop:79940 length:651 start_codon:yes stop_codon:yes gene_type:complete
VHKTSKYFDEMGIEVFWYKKNKKTINFLHSDTIDELSLQVENCTKCSLHNGRTQTVFGDGLLQSNILIIGEAPGRDEDKQGKPFVGRAGKLLTEILKSINIQRSDVYITNTVKCRPPDNRNPSKEEVDACSNYLESQIEIIKPHLIILLGKVAADRLLNLDLPMSELRQKTYYYKANKIPVVVFYHPAYLLRSPSEKSKVWDDLNYMKNVFTKNVG